MDNFNKFKILFSFQIISFQLYIYNRTISNYLKQFITISGNPNYPRQSLTIPSITNNQYRQSIRNMLKQRHSSSILSSKLSKTLSRPKFINKTTNQYQNSFIQERQNKQESSKEIRTLRQGNKNKSCLIPKHLAQSTQSQIINNSTSSKNYKSTMKNYSNQHQNMSQNQLQCRNNFISSSFTIPHQSEIYNLNDNKTKVINSYQPCQPYLSVQQPLQTFNNPFYGINSNIQPFKNQEAKNFIAEANQKVNFSILQNNLVNNSNASILRQKILQKQIKQMFLYKNKELTKILEQMHRFCICVKELKWICQETYHLIKHYNQQLQMHYRAYFQEPAKMTDIQNMVKQSELLLKRFNQLESLNQNEQGLFNFTMFSNKIINSSASEQTEGAKNVKKTKSIEKQSKSPQNPHSWSKLIQNIQQQQFIRPFQSRNQQALIPNDDNKNMTIKTFQITQNSSPLKNKTLNQLIRLSELRKTQFNYNLGTQNKQNNQLSLNNTQTQNQMSTNQAFNKKPFNINLASKESSNQKDPFDSIHLPHFNSKNKQVKTNQSLLKQKNKMLLEQQKSYENQILKLKKQVETHDKENNQYFRKLRNKNQQLEKQNASLKNQVKQIKQLKDKYKKNVDKLVEKSLNQLIICTRMNKKLKQDKNMKICYQYLSTIFKNSYSLQKQKPIILEYNSFNDLITFLQDILKLNFGQQNYYSTSAKQQICKSKENQKLNQKTCRANYSKQQSRQQISQLQMKKHVLQRQISQLFQTKQQLEIQLEKLSSELNEIQENNNNLFKHQNLNGNNGSNQSKYQQMQQMLFLQAYTIEQMIQMDENEENCVE